jgi:hypothetical protein
MLTCKCMADAIFDWYRSATLLQFEVKVRSRRAWWEKNNLCFISNLDWLKYLKVCLYGYIGTLWTFLKSGNILNENLLLTAGRLSWNVITVQNGNTNANYIMLTFPSYSIIC